MRWRLIYWYIILEDNVHKYSTPVSAFPPPTIRIKTTYRLRTRMGISFVIVTLVIVLLIEVMISATVYLVRT